MTIWVRCYWDEEDTWFYFEVDAEGWVIRQVELDVITAWCQGVNKCPNWVNE
ncbi:hypothetical protein ACF053_27465 [Streptomyces kanasensis]|uniref:hypothetical protein n=1 Tax=Streptomyces kanasensis TaxID=936756 RepID=UPI0036FE909C